MPHSDPAQHKAYQKQYQAEWYQRNKNKVKEASRENTPRYIQRNRDFVNSLKVETGCFHCGYNKHSAALDFHHVKGDKDRTIAKLVLSAASIGRIKNEIDKCVVLCANCHRIVHAN